jgi:hypothetical protein
MLGLVSCGCRLITQVVHGGVVERRVVARAILELSARRWWHALVSQALADVILYLGTGHSTTAPFIFHQHSTPCRYRSPTLRQWHLSSGGRSPSRPRSAKMWRPRSNPRSAHSTTRHSSSIPTSSPPRHPPYPHHEISSDFEPPSDVRTSNRRSIRWRRATCANASSMARVSLAQRS